MMSLDRAVENDDVTLVHVARWVAASDWRLWSICFISEEHLLELSTPG